MREKHCVQVLQSSMMDGLAVAAHAAVVSAAAPTMPTGDPLVEADGEVGRARQGSRPSQARLSQGQKIALQAFSAQVQS